MKLVIELDGDIHNEKSVQFTDENRELNLKFYNLYILRYKNEDIYHYAVVEDIRQMVIELRGRKKKRRL